MIINDNAKCHYNEPYHIITNINKSINISYDDIENEPVMYAVNCDGYCKCINDMLSSHILMDRTSNIVWFIGMERNIIVF